MTQPTPDQREIERLYIFQERVAIKCESGIPLELAERQAREEMGLLFEGEIKCK